jgi:hypothetical protein
MSERPFEEIRASLKNMVQEAEYRGEATVVLEAAVALMELSGECRVEEPFKPMRPVLTQKGFRWCCTHNPEHCSDYLGLN